MPFFKHILHLLCYIEGIFYHNIIPEAKYPSKELRADCVGLQYILDSRQKRMQGKRQSVIVELLHKTVRKELTLRGNYNTGYEV